MYLTREARELGKELAGINHDVGEGKVPIEALRAFRKNYWSVLDDRTVITIPRPNVLDKRLDMDTLDITSRGTPFGLLKDGRLWVDEMIASKESVRDRLYLHRNDGGVFIDGDSAYSLGDAMVEIASDDGRETFDAGRSTIVTADKQGCVLLAPLSDKVCRFPDGKLMRRPGSLIVHGAITDPTKPMCIWGEEQSTWVAYVQLEDRSLGRCRINNSETVVDVAVLGKNIALSVRAHSGKYQLRLVTVDGTLETWEQYNHDTPIRELVWLDERILLGKHEGKLFVWDLRKRNIDMKPFEGEVVQGPVHHPDGRVMAIVKRPAMINRELLVLTPSVGVELGGKYSLMPGWFIPGKALLLGPYVLLYGDGHVEIAELMGDAMMSVYRNLGANLEGFRMTNEQIYVVSQRAGKHRLASCPRRSGDRHHAIELEGAYKTIDVTSAIDILLGDRGHRLLAKVQLEDGRWQVADQDGPLGDPAHGIYGLRVVTEGPNTFIRWTARHRRELVDCTCKAF